MFARANYHFKKNWNYSCCFLNRRSRYAGAPARVQSNAGCRSSVKIFWIVMKALAKSKYLWCHATVHPTYAACQPEIVMFVCLFFPFLRFSLY